MRRRPLLLSAARLAIDQIDDGLLLLLAARRGVVAVAARSKQRGGVPVHDPEREARVLARGARLARRLGLAPGSARAVLALAIEDGRGLQQRPAPAPGPTASLSRDEATQAEPMNDATSHPVPDADRSGIDRWLALLPPPRRLAPLLALLPTAPRNRVFARVLGRALAPAAASGALAFLEGRRIGVDAVDLGLSVAIGIREGRLLVDDGPVEASVRGSTCDLLALAGRLEDADALFFHRRLQVTGDTELGLTARNVLDGLSWEDLPLPLRVVLNRTARMARRARAAHQVRQGVMAAP